MDVLMAITGFSVTSRGGCRWEARGLLGAGERLA